MRNKLRIVISRAPVPLLDRLLLFFRMGYVSHHSCFSDLGYCLYVNQKLQNCLHVNKKSRKVISRAPVPLLVGSDGGQTAVIISHGLCESSQLIFWIGILPSCLGNKCDCTHCLHVPAWIIRPQARGFSILFASWEALEVSITFTSWDGGGYFTRTCHNC